jgi:glutaminyl-peptide cyclotransferase
MKPMYRLFPIVFSVLFVTSCGQKTTPDQKPKEPSQTQRVNTIPTFDGKNAFRYLKAQTAFGPRNPGSSSHEQCKNYLAQELQKYAEAVNLQPFPHTGYRGEHYTMTNIIASFNLQATKRVMLCAHWDTRPEADMERNSARRALPILGANDGASGVSVLLELARIFNHTPPPIGIDIVLFDGEDFGRSGDLGNYFLGSRYFATQKPPSFNPRFAILLDLVGDKNLLLPKEGFSVQFAPEVVRLIWETARDLGVSQFLDSVGGTIEDDHIPLNNAGIPTVDIIDLDLVGGSAPQPDRKYWHTHQDTPDRCSPESLEAVGKVLAHFLYALPSQF